MSVQERKKLMKLLQEANKRNNDLLERLEDVFNDRDRWEKSYRELYKENCRLETQLLCESCKEDKQQTPDGKTFVLCDDCNDKIADWKKRVRTLEERVKYWEQCYESLLEEHFKDDRRDYDGSQPRN